MTNQFDRTASNLEVRHTVLRYPEASDTGDLAGVGRVYDGVRFGSYGVPESELSPRPADQVAKQYGESVIYYPDGLSHAKHLITNVDIAYSDDGNEAQARSFYVVLQARPELPLQVICTGGYEDTFRLTEDRWQFSVRREWMDIKGDLSYHVFSPVRIETGHGPSGALRPMGPSATNLPSRGGSGAGEVDSALAVEEIRRIILSYPERVDRGDFAGVGRLLDGVRIGGAVGRNAPIVSEEDLESRSASEIEEMYRSTVLTYEDGLPNTKHLITNIDVAFSDDMRSAQTRSYYTVLQAMASFPLQIVISGRYEDDFNLTKDGWRLEVRREYADLVGDLSHHVSPEAVEMLSGQH
jgi:3-phenylpropionate/cinnamic acid dioxygenase small subunit